MRPGGIAKVVAECSTIAGPSISWPAATPSSRTIAVSASPPDQRTVRVALTGGEPESSSSSGSAGFSTSTEPWTIAWVIR